jgi:hypothetical protein
VQILHGTTRLGFRLCSTDNGSAYKGHTSGYKTLGRTDSHRAQQATPLIEKFEVKLSKTNLIVTMEIYI